MEMKTVMMMVMTMMMTIMTTMMMILMIIPIMSHLSITLIIQKQLIIKTILIRH
ncbi:unnamed protein product [Schistosoma curassoni]|uniref:Uncharacterized protein n=1 Tax=Schistosoma curassoni TaxID=6186 RepID=A0A183KL49_9TREM|nr:unnamed protein product [Schistosoma curassoni]